MDSQGDVPSEVMVPILRLRNQLGKIKDMNGKGRRIKGKSISNGINLHAKEGETKNISHQSSGNKDHHTD